jgi:hypothetical protein
VNFSNKSYTPKDEHMAAYLEEHRKMEKRIQGLELKHIPRGENVEVDEIAKHASHRLAQPAGVFEEHLFKPSASPLTTGSDLPPALPPPPEQGAPDCRPPSGDRVLLALARQEGLDWILELKTFLVSSKLPEDESEAERIVRQASGYCVKDGDLYRHRPNGVALKCISTHQGQELLRDIHAGECGHHVSASTLAAKAYHIGFYWPSALWDAAEMVKRCEACQFHAKHQPAQELQTTPLTCVDGFRVARTRGTTRRTKRFERKGLNVGDLGSQRNMVMEASSCRMHNALQRGTPSFTQVQGPRGEVKSLLPAFLYYNAIPHEEYKVLVTEL